jgi:hypothetical protein
MQDAALLGLLTCQCVLQHGVALGPLPRLGLSHPAAARIPRASSFVCGSLRTGALHSTEVSAC